MFQMPTLDLTGTFGLILTVVGAILFLIGVFGVIFRDDSHRKLFYRMFLTGLIAFVGGPILVNVGLRNVKARTETSVKVAAVPAAEFRTQIRRTGVVTDASRQIVGMNTLMLIVRLDKQEGSSLEFINAVAPTTNSAGRHWSDGERVTVSLLSSELGDHMAPPHMDWFVQ